MRNPNNNDSNDNLWNVPCLCIWKGQIPTRTVHNVVLHNFLPDTILGFVASEVVNEQSGLKGEVEMVDSVDPSNGSVTQIPIPPVTEDQCDALVGAHLCPGCEVMEGKCPGLCEDPPDVDNEGMPAPTPVADSCIACSDHVSGDCDGVDPENCGMHDHYITHSDIDESVHIDDDHNCLNCRHGNLSICDEPCDGCFDANEWVVHPDTIEALNETLYRTGCWIALENRLHDLMSEWSLLASKCQYASDDAECEHTDNHGVDCDYGQCPRINE
jgi:hypothetical protein